MKRTASDQPAVDPEFFRETLGRFATGVAVATTVGEDGAPVGVTVNSFTSVSLQPPMVLFCLDRDASSLPAFVAARYFAINILAADQLDLCRLFARQAGGWNALAYERWKTGAPILADCLAAVDCTLAHLYEGGDHRIMVGSVLCLGQPRQAEPLVYYGGAFAHLDRRRSLEAPVSLDDGIDADGLTPSRATRRQPGRRCHNA